MIELYTQVKYDKVKGKNTTVIKTIRIDKRTVAKYDETKGQINLSPLKDHVGETVYIYEKNGKQYSHKAKIDSVEHVTEADGTEGDVLNLGPTVQLFDVSKAAAMEAALQNRSEENAEDIPSDRQE
jgi:hypothetical protein